MGPRGFSSSPSAPGWHPSAGSLPSRLSVLSLGPLSMEAPKLHNPREPFPWNPFPSPDSGCSGDIISLGVLE